MKSLLKDYLKALLVSCILGFIFVTYMFFIGIPKTKAAGYYELAKQEEGLGSIDKANEYYNLSLNSFTENYILKDYEKFKEKLR